MHPDDGFQTLESIYSEFKDFCAKRGQTSEADTRVKIIDRILKEVLGWTEGVIERENPVHKGYIDYVLAPKGGRGLVVVEAKREGVSFDVAIQRNVIRYKLNGSIKTNKDLYAAIEQAQYYCVDKGIRFAVVTNGYAWIVFRALREDIPWREGVAIVFSSAGIIKDRFTEFWNLLSPGAVSTGALETALASSQPVTRKLFRVLDRLYNPDQLLLRNRLHVQLSPIVNRIFGDIADNDEVEILQRCYVHSRTLRVIDENLQMVITDAAPRFAALEGAEETTPGPFDAGPFGEAIKRSTADSEGSVFLLLGGIGAGKSTFLKRFFKFVGRPFMEKAGCWFYVPFLHAPDISSLERYVYQTILDQLRRRYAHERLETRDSLIKAYAEEIQVLNETIFNAEQLSEVEYQRRLSAYLEEWVRDLPGYVRALLRTLRQRGRAVVICVDNVDQLSPDYQNRIFLFSQRLAGELSSITIVALREETFYSATIQRTFTAYTNRKFHIASPSFRTLIGQRLKYAREVLTFPERKASLILRTGTALDKNQINDFLAIIQDSLFKYNRNIARFIECTSSGNMREALDMFAGFLYSGSTDVDKMLGIYSKAGEYFVAFHEFAKAVILGDRRFYRESSSKVMNVFDCGPERNSSHFTALRILNFLLDHHGANSPEGRGFVGVEHVLAVFLDVLDNEEDFFRTADRLLRRSLIEVDTRATDTIRQANHIRLTPAGWYYVTFLSKSFSYLDLMLQDTPINDEETVEELVDLVKRVDQIVDSDQTKREKLELRFGRVNIFLKYLEREETAERALYRLDTVKASLGREVVRPIRDQYEKEISGIKSKLASIFYTDDEVEVPDLPSGLHIPTDESEEPN